MKLSVLMKIILAPCPPMTPIMKSDTVVKESAVRVERSSNPAITCEIDNKRPPIIIVFFGPNFL